MAAPTVYRWDDAGAPIARGNKTSLCDILRACLVDGYGEKPAAGWTLEFISITEDKAVFRNSPDTGTGSFLRVDGTFDTYEYKHHVQGYETMTTIDAGLFPFSATDVYANTSQSNGTIVRPWILIADDRFFYFICWGNVSGAIDNGDIYLTGMAFGDIVPIYPGDNHACGIYANNGSFKIGNVGESKNTVSSEERGIQFARDAEGVARQHIATLIGGGGPGAPGHRTEAGRDGTPYVDGNLMFVSRPYLNQAIAYTVRGYIPGFYYPCHSYESFDQLGVVSTEGKTFLSLRISIYYEGCLFISLDDWWT